MRCETDILGPGPPVQTLAPRVRRECHFPSGKPASKGILIGLDCLSWRQPELINRSRFRQHSRMPRQIALVSPPVTN
jgi:hypothetical protein